MRTLPDTDPNFPRGAKASRRAPRRATFATLAACALATALGAAPAPAPAQEAAFPSRPISLVVPFAPGGSLDLTARILADRMKEDLGQPVVVVNRPGAGSSVGARSVASAAPDGHTLFITSGSAFGFLHLLVKGYTLQLSDFAPIAGVSTNTSLFAVNAKVPAKTLQALVALARGKGSPVNFCTTGVGGLNHLQLEMLKRQAAAGGAPIDVTHVPYNGLAPALTALRAGTDVQACALPYSALVRNLHGTEIRVLAVQRPKRLPSMPDVPTTGETGFAALDGNEAFVNISAPKGTPPAVLRKLEGAVRTAMQDPAVLKRLEDIDVQPVFVDSAAIRKWLEDDVRKLGGIIRDAGLVVNQ
ncbi:MAG: Bug family tripartite tricarboxylate transporter substrate binding protein [Lautropia sp.]